MELKKLIIENGNDIYEFSAGDTSALMAMIEELQNEVNTLKEQIASMDISNVVTKDEIEEFDTRAFKDDLQAIFDNAEIKAQSDLVTSGQVEEFDLQAYHIQLQNDVAEAKKDLVTAGEVEEFDTAAFKEDIRGML